MSTSVLLRRRGAVLGASLFFVLATYYYVLVGLETGSQDDGNHLLAEPFVPGDDHRFGAACSLCMKTRCAGSDGIGCDARKGFADPSGDQTGACMCGCCALQCNVPRACEASPAAFNSNQRFNSERGASLTALGPGSAAPPSSTSWATTQTAPGVWALTRNGAPFKIKGACYSPTEIAGDINFVYQADGTTMWGDYFWDSVPAPQTLWNWFGLWGAGMLNPPWQARGDLERMRALGINAVRTYFMQSRLYTPDSPGGQALPYQKCAPRSHQSFLDASARNNISVIVGIALPADMMKLDLFQIWQRERPGNIQWWLDVIRETAAQVGSHPAVMGFTIMNELDDMPNAFPYTNPMGLPVIAPATDRTNFWYARAILYASLIKENAPGKLVGWAIHDAPVFVKWASTQRPLNDGSLDPLLDPSKTYMAQLSAAFDFYGVNTYQTMSLETVLGAHAGFQGDELSYGDPSIAAQMKPVILTEIGWSAAGRVDPSNPTSALTDTPTTQANVADVMDRVLRGCFSTYAGMCLGSFWFEFADEWFKQGTPTEWNGNPNKSPGFPNGYWDDEAFGLYSRHRQGGRLNNSNNWAGSGPTLPMDGLTPRTPMTDMLRRIYA